MIEDALIDLLTAIEFLTVLPIRRIPRVGQRLAARMGGTLASTLPWFPFIGGMLGLGVALLDGLASHTLGVGVRSVGVLVAWALVTGFLHLDGFIDCCDALLGTREITRRLEILRDSRIGSYGAAGAGLLLLTQFAALTAIPGNWRFVALILAPTLSRWSMTYAVIAYPYAREKGLGAGFVGTGRHLLLATVVTAAIVLGLGLIFPGSFATRFTTLGLAIMCSIAGALFWTWWASRRLGGGLTGDTYGALNEIVTTLVWISLSRH